MTAIRQKDYSKRPSQRLEHVWTALNYLLIAILVMFAFFPFLWMVITSVKTEDQMRSLARIQEGDTVANAFVPDPVYFENYRELLEEQPFGTWFFNSALVSFASSFLAIAVGSIGAYAITRLKFRGSGVLGILVLVTYLVPPVILFIPMYSLLRTLGILNSIFGLILVYPTITVPFATWVLMGFFDTIPRELDEAALIDGCNRWGAFWRVSLPLIAPGLAAAGMFAFTLAWNEYLYAFVFITDRTQTTLPVAISKMIQGDVYLWGQLMASATLTTLPVIIFYIYLQRFMVDGLAVGGVKG